MASAEAAGIIEHMRSAQHGLRPAQPRASQSSDSPHRRAAGQSFGAAQALAQRMGELQSPMAIPWQAAPEAGSRAPLISGRLSHQLGRNPITRSGSPRWPHVASSS